MDNPNALKMTFGGKLGHKRLESEAFFKASLLFDNKKQRMASSEGGMCLLLNKSSRGGSMRTGTHVTKHDLNEQMATYPVPSGHALLATKITKLAFNLHGAKHPSF